MTELPEEAREAVLSLATGVRPAAAPISKPILPEQESAAPGVWPRAALWPIPIIAGLIGPWQPYKRSETVVAAFSHPDAQRRFRTVANLDELQAALDAPWEKWAVFLHPAQRALVERDFSGPARVTGSAGTGKTIVALHRAVYLAQSNGSSRVLLTTFSNVLAKTLHNQLRLLIANRPRLGEQIEVLAFEAVARRLYDSNLIHTYGPAIVATDGTVRELLDAAIAAELPTQFSGRFILSEWKQVVDAAQLRTWESYRDYNRLGRRSRLREPQRRALWNIFMRVLDELEKRSEMTTAQMFTRVTEHYAKGATPPFNFAVVDEAQDVSQAELRCLGALGGGRRNALFFAGDTGQRIFQQLFSWKSAGVEVRGRSTNLKVNYRTSHQIREQADRLLAAEVTDGDGLVEDRRGAVSVFNGPAPEIRQFADQASEEEFVAAWLAARRAEGMRPEEMAIFVRSTQQLDRGEAAARLANIPSRRLAEEMTTEAKVIPVCTMHLAKGLESRAVVIMACEEDVLPDAERLGAAGDASELEEVYNSERQLLYVACTRARDRLLISSASTSSEFLRDMSNLS